MGNIFKAFFFKLKKDLAFKITLGIGLGIAVFMAGLFFFIDCAINDFTFPLKTHLLMSGEFMLFNQFSPFFNFGIAIPINLIALVCMEFSNGTIRDKIISGYSKGKIFAGLYLTGIVYTFILLAGYVLISFGLGCALGGFHPHGTGIPLYNILALGNTFNPEFLIKFIILNIFGYGVIASMTIFFASVFRHMGPSIPVVVVLIMGCQFSTYIYLILSSGIGGEEGIVGDIFTGLAEFTKAVNPLHSICTFDVYIDEVTRNQFYTITWASFWEEIISNVIYIGAFFGFGLLIFSKRDVK